jgi:hypothetical protein
MNVSPFLPLKKNPALETASKKAWMPGRPISQPKSFQQIMMRAAATPFKKNNGQKSTFFDPANKPFFLKQTGGRQ